MFGSGTSVEGREGDELVSEEASHKMGGVGGGGQRRAGQEEQINSTSCCDSMKSSLVAMLASSCPTHTIQQIYTRKTIHSMTVAPLFYSGLSVFIT